MWKGRGCEPGIHSVPAALYSVFLRTGQRSPMCLSGPGAGGQRARDGPIQKPQKWVSVLLATPMFRTTDRSALSTSVFSSVKCVWILMLQAQGIWRLLIQWCWLRQPPESSVSYLLVLPPFYRWAPEAQGGCVACLNGRTDHKPGDWPRSSQWAHQVCLFIYLFITGNQTQDLRLARESLCPWAISLAGPDF